MSLFSGLRNPFAEKSVSQLEAEKTAEVAKVNASYDAQISAAKQKESQTPSGATDSGTTSAVGGRKKTRKPHKLRRAKKGKSRKSRK